jgi:large subunit ribosomal protein L10
MNRQQKKVFVSKLQAQLSSTESSLMVGYQGLTVAQMQRLRRGLRAVGGEFKISKARLLKKAIDENSQEKELLPFCKGQVGIVLVNKSSQTPAVLKVLYNFSKEHEALTLVAGASESKFLDSAMMKALATLPSREVLLAMVCGTLKAPITKLAYVLQQVSEKKQ